MTLELPGLGGALEPGRVIFSLKLDGDPRHKARHRSRIVHPKGGKAFIHNYPDPETEAFEKTLAAAARIRMGHRAPYEGPLCLLVIADRAIPKSWSKADRAAAIAGRILPTSKPDWDNYGKITDALNKVVWNDDSQIVDSRVMKRYSPAPCLRITIWEMTSPTPE